MRNKTFQPRFERLESRQMMAGDVTATFTDRNLFLREAAGQSGLENAIRISNLPGAITRVEGLLKADGTQTLINGEPYKDFTWVLDLSIVLGGGNDRVVIDPVHTPSYKNVLIDVAAPPLVIANAKMARTGLGDTIFDLPDNDIVDVGSLTTGGFLTINTGAGNDQVSVADFNIGGVVGNPGPVKDLKINTGAGADTVFVGTSPLYGNYVTVVGNLDIQTYSSASETDVDQVTLKNVVTNGSLPPQVRLGDGGDIFDSYATNVVLDAGAGNDHAHVSWGTVQIGMGDGDDTVEIDGLTATSAQHFSGGAGIDRISYKNVLGSANLIQLSEWEYINGFRVWPVFAVYAVGGSLRAQ